MRNRSREAFDKLMESVSISQATSLLGFLAHWQDRQSVCITKYIIANVLGVVKRIYAACAASCGS